MADWKVLVLLDSGLMTEVEVKGYTYPDDARRAALSMTGGVSVINFTSIKDSSSSREPERSSHSTVDMQEPRYYNTSTSPIKLDPETENVAGYFAVIVGLSPFIIVALIIAPFIAIPLLIWFTLWWFKS